MANRFPTTMVNVGPVKIQDADTESFVTLDTFQCSQLPQSFNSQSPKIMRRGTITGLVQTCGSDSNKYHVARMTIKFEVLADDLPTGTVNIVNPTGGFVPFTSVDVKDTLEYMIEKAEEIIVDLVNGNGSYPSCSV